MNTSNATKAKVTGIITSAGAGLLVVNKLLKEGVLSHNNQRLILGTVVVTGLAFLYFWNKDQEGKGVAGVTIKADSATPIQGTVIGGKIN